MDTIHICALSYMMAVSIIAFCLMGIDKKRTEKRKWRISEATLFIFAVAGGGIGAVAGMLAFRHKTKHWYFVLFMPLIAVIQTVAFVLIF